MATKTKKKTKKKTVKRKVNTKKKKTNLKNKQQQNKIIAIIAFVLIFVLIIASCIAKSLTDKGVPKTVDLGKDVAVGVDISKHNGKIDFDKLKKECDFVIIRVGYRGYADGKIHADKKAKEYLTSAKKAGIPAGIYFYSQAVNEKEAQAEARFALKYAKQYDVELPVFYDFEYAASKGKQTGRLHDAHLNTDENTALVNAFCDTVQKNGKMCGVYASTYMFESHFRLRAFSKNMYIWVADYNNEMSYDGKYDIWQYTNKGKLKSTGNKKFDINYWYFK